MSIGLYPLSVLSRILVSLLILFLPVCLISYWRLIPSLSPNARRLAGAMLALQVTVIGLSLFLQPATDFEQRLWSINREFNIPSIIASMQLGSVAGVALLGAWLAKQHPTLTRLYLFGLCLIFAWGLSSSSSGSARSVPNWPNGCAMTTLAGSSVGPDCC